MFCVVGYVWAIGVPTRCSHPMLLSTTRNRCELVGHRYDPIKLEKPIVQIMIVISDSINTKEPTVFMAQVVQTSHLPDASRRLTVILTASCYPYYVEFIFY